MLKIADVSVIPTCFPILGENGKARTSEMPFWPYVLPISCICIPTLVGHALAQPWVTRCSSGLIIVVHMAFSRRTSIKFQCIGDIGPDDAPVKSRRLRKLGTERIICSFVGLIAVYCKGSRKQQERGSQGKGR